MNELTPKAKGKATGTAIAPPKGAASARFISIGDVTTALTLAFCAPFAWFSSQRAMQALCRLLARLHILLRGSKASQLAGHAAIRHLDYDASELELRFTATVYEETLYALREYRGRGWYPSITLRGREHIDKALAAGRGAILWVCPFSHAELFVKKALYAAGIPLVNLRSYIHPYSATRFGQRFLNPIRTSIEDRYLSDTVVLYPNREAVALRELQMRLRNNSVVSIFAIAAGDRPFETPCLSGTLKLALGAPTLALLSRAPLLPVHILPNSSEDFEVTIESPVQRNVRQGHDRAEEDMGRAYAKLTEDCVNRSPQVWRGWFSRSLWTPN